MNEPISAFLADRKDARLKAKLKDLTNEEERFTVRQTVENEFSLATWLPHAANRVAQLSMVSHPGKFSHPSAKTSSIIADNGPAQDGYVRTGNVAYELDVFGNAAAMDVYKFLCLMLDDGQTVLQHLERNSETIRQIFNIPTASYETLRAGFLAVKQTSEHVRTDGWVKQVYFPVDTDYHLLSLLTPAGLLTQNKSRIDAMRFSDTTKQARDSRRKNQYHPDGFDDISGLTVTLYGGTKPQNISVLNNQNAGRAYLLSSLPPTLEQRQVRLPTRHFFKNTLTIRRFQDSFQALNQLIRADINNIHIRNGIRNTLQYIIDSVLEHALRIRTSQPGWSDAERYQNLPLAHRIWLDDAHMELRKQNDDWLKQVSNDFARWIISAYEYLCKEGYTALSDNEFRALSTWVEQAITADKELFR